MGTPTTRRQPDDDRDSPADALGPLVPAAASGDRAAMRALLGGVAPVIARACRRVLGRANPEAEDVAQQALAGFVERLDTFRGQSSVAHFAERIAVYRALSARRDAGVRRRVVDLAPAAGGELREACLDEAASGEARVDDRQRRALLVRALVALPEAQAEALALHFLFEHSIPEIAGIVGAPAETVRSRLRLGKQALRELITSDAALAPLREVTA